MTTDAVIWLTSDGVMDPRGWSDTMQEVATEAPELAKQMRDEELGALMPRPESTVGNQFAN